MARGRGGAAKAVGALPWAVGARPRPWRHGQGSLGCGQCRGGADSSRGGATKTVRPRPRPLGVPKGHGGVAKVVVALPGAVGVQPRPWGHGKGPWGCGQDRGGIARGRWCVANAVGA